MYCRKLRVRSAAVFGRLMSLGGSLARHSGSPLPKTLSMTFSTLSGLSDMMKVDRRSCLPRTSRALLEGPWGTLSSRACLPSQGLRMTTEEPGSEGKRATERSTTRGKGSKQGEDRTAEGNRTTNRGRAHRDERNVAKRGTRAGGQTPVPATNRKARQRAPPPGEEEGR